MLMFCFVAMASIVIAKVWLGLRKPVTLSTLSYTNTCAVVTLANRTPGPLDYIVKVERNGSKGWPVYVSGFPVGKDFGQSGALPAAATTNLTLAVMTYAPSCPWRVSVFLPGKGMQSNPASLRFRAWLWCLRLHMPWLAREVFGHAK